MSKKYVPSFLKQEEPPTATVPFDAFSINRKQKENSTISVIDLSN
jgi:hypothetical protein